MDAWLWWVGAALVLAVIEMLTLDLVFVMMAGGALAGALTAALNGPVWLQFVVASATALLLMVGLRPWLLKHLRGRVPLVETNAAAHVGRPAVALTEVSELGGRVKLAGEVWSARLADDGDPGSTARVPEGTELRVVRIDGATAVVEPVPSSQSQPERTA
jgi:membrane protein implicated in regulation of membrane protease activity